MSRLPASAPVGGRGALAIDESVAWAASTLVRHVRARAEGEVSGEGFEPRGRSGYRPNGLQEQCGTAQRLALLAVVVTFEDVSRTATRRRAWRPSCRRCRGHRHHVHPIDHEQDLLQGHHRRHQMPISNRLFPLERRPVMERSRRPMDPAVTISVTGDSGMPQAIPVPYIPGELMPTAGPRRAAPAGIVLARRTASRRKGRGRCRRPAGAEPERGWVDPRPRAALRSMLMSSTVPGWDDRCLDVCRALAVAPGLRRAVVALLQVAGQIPTASTGSAPLPGRARDLLETVVRGRGTRPPAWWGTWHLRKHHKQAGMIPLECGLADGAAMA
jgi:hypothetical protein